MFSHFQYAVVLALALAGLVQALAKPPAEAPADKFDWGVIGDSWSSGVAYSSKTVWKHKAFERCMRTNEAWGPVLDKKDWTEQARNFQFLACGGALMEEVGKQFQPTDKWAPRLLITTFGGNDALFGVAARACIYQARISRSWGPEYADDAAGTGKCKQALKDARAFIQTKLEADITQTLDSIFATAQKMLTSGRIPRFDLYVSGYVHLFNSETDACDNWSFASGLVSKTNPRLVKGLRKEFNELVTMFNAAQERVVKAYKLPHPDAHIKWMTPSPLFEGHRFCEPNHELRDQFYSKDVWLWNLQFKSGDLGPKNPEPVGEQPKPGVDDALSKTKEGVTVMDSLPMTLDVRDSKTVMMVDTADQASSKSARRALQGLPGPVETRMGKLTRPFHPKPLGHHAIADFFWRTIASDNVPGVKPY